MFRSALLKLTGFYFIILLTVCLALSIPAYLISSNRIEKGSANQLRILNEFAQGPQAFPDQEDRPEFDPDEILRDEVYQQRQNDRRDLLRGLLLADLAILASGTVMCFYFARRTLAPIEKLHIAQSRFASDASHELRTPLAVMKTEIEVALKQKPSVENLKEVLSSNLEEIERLTELSNQLLTLTHIEDRETTHVRFDLSKLVNESVEKFEIKNNLKIEKNVAPDISINGIPTLITDLLNILLSNAKQYAGDSPAKIEVELSKFDHSKSILKVRDHGIGISEEDLDKVFTRFFRSTQATTHFREGHGLGLSLASEIAKRHGSRIEVSSELGSFTEFRLVL